MTYTEKLLTNAKSRWEYDPNGCGDVWRCLALACCFLALAWRFDFQFLEKRKQETDITPLAFALHGSFRQPFGHF